MSFPAQVIVNAANSSLAGGGGVDGAIHRAAGKELVIYCRSFLHKCSTGQAKISPSFQLEPAEYIIHAVGPKYQKNDVKTSSQLLSSCYINSLDLARDFHSVAFSSISTGIYGYPIIDATYLALKTMIMWVVDNPETTLDTITLCAFTLKEYESMVSALTQLLQEENS